MATTLTINVTGIAGGTAPGSFIRVDLQNCANGRVIGTGQLVPQTLMLRPTNGLFTVNLFDNTQITCGAVNVIPGCGCTTSSTCVSYYTFNFIYQGEITSLGSYNLKPGTYNLWDLKPCIGSDCICNNCESDIPLISEEPNGIVDGSNTVFGLKMKPTKLWLMQSGVFMTEGVDYSLADNIITFFVAPTSSLWAIYTFSTCTPSINSEVPAGIVDGTNRIFTVTQYLNPGGIWLYVNGVYQTLGTDYTISGKQITFTNAPSLGSILYIDYVTGNVNNPVGTITTQVPSGVIDGVNTVFTIAGPNRFVMLQLNSALLQPGVGFTQSGNTLTLAIAPSIGDVLLATLFN